MLNIEAHGMHCAPQGKRRAKSSAPEAPPRKYRPSVEFFQGRPARKISSTQRYAGCAAFSLGVVVRLRWSQRAELRIAAYQDDCTRTRARSESSTTIFVASAHENFKSLWKGAGES